MKSLFSFQGFFCWGLATLFFLYEFFLQVFLGTVTTEIISDLNLLAEQFAFLGSSFYFAYAIMQPNVGILADRFGVKKCLSVAVFICVLGVFSLYLAQGFWEALFARFLMGIGSSFAFISILVLSLNWFPKNRFGLFSGLAQFLGAIGPFLAGAPLAVLMQVVNGNWRLILFWMAVFGLLLWLMIVFFLRNKPKGKRKKLIFLHPETSFREKIGYLVQNSQVWWIFLYAALIYVTLPLLGAYWGVEYLESRGFSHSSAALIVSMQWFGLSLFCPLLGYSSDKVLRRKPFLIFPPLLGVVASSAILYAPVSSEAFLIFLFFLLGASSAGQSLSFALVAENVSKKIHGLILGFNNFFITLFVSIIPPVITYIIQGAKNKNIVESTFTTENFQKGFVFIPIFYFFAFIIAMLIIQETYCRQKFEVQKIQIF